MCPLIRASESCLKFPEMLAVGGVEVGDVISNHRGDCALRANSVHASDSFCFVSAGLCQRLTSLDTLASFGTGVGDVFFKTLG